MGLNVKKWFKEEDEDVEKIYIGHQNIMKDSTYEMLVYDWRAPIASMFIVHPPTAVICNLVRDRKSYAQQSLLHNRNRLLVPHTLSGPYRSEKNNPQSHWLRRSTRIDCYVS